MRILKYLIVIVVTSHVVNADICGQEQTNTLWAGQTIDAGMVTVSNDETNIFITYSTSSDWLIQESHTHIATSIAEIPQSKSGNPKIGNFDYKQSYEPLISTVTLSIDLNANGWEPSNETTISIAAHAALIQLDDAGNIIASETGWGEGLGFPGNSWAMAISYQLQSCNGDQPIRGNGWRTQTQGGWGSIAKGNNPGTLRDGLFHDVFPNGLVIGAGVAGGNGQSILFTSPLAVKCFLPQGGTASALTQNYADPGILADESCDAGVTTEAGVLAGQVTALSFNVAFDEYCNGGANGCTFSGNDFDGTTLLKNLVLMNTGTICDGMTVNAVLSEAHFILAGDVSVFSPSEMNACVSLINENYVDGTTDLNHLIEP